MGELALDRVVLPFKSEKMNGNNSTIYKYFGLLLVLVVSLYFPKRALSQISGSGIAIPISIQSDGVRDGSIICSGQGGFAPCSEEYSLSIYAVINDSPAASFETGEDDERLIMTTGLAQALVSSINGNISEGDLITSSQFIGVGQKAIRNGFVLGTALESYESDDVDSAKKILVAINIHAATGLSTARTDLIQALRGGLSLSLLEPLDTLRYFLAALIVLVSFTLSLIYFGRVGKSGVEAIGRNPLASRMIQISILIHIAVSVVIIIAGMGIAYLILIL